MGDQVVYCTPQRTAVSLECSSVTLWCRQGRSHLHVHACLSFSPHSCTALLLARSLLLGLLLMRDGVKKPPSCMQKSRSARFVRDNISGSLQSICCRIGTLSNATCTWTGRHWTWIIHHSTIVKHAAGPGARGRSVVGLNLNSSR